MSSHSLERPDMEEYRLEQTVLQPSSVPPTRAQVQAQGVYRSTSSQDAGHKIGGMSRKDVEEFMDFLNAVAEDDQFLMEEDKNMEIAELKVHVLSTQAATAESKFERWGIIEDIDQAIEYRSWVLSLTLEGHEEKPGRLSDLGTAFLYRFHRTGELEDLDMAIKHITQAVLLTPDGDSRKYGWLNDLGSSYESRFECLGELADLNRVIDLRTQEAQLTPNGYPYKPSSLGNLGNAYGARFKQLGELVDLNKAIEYQTQAVLLALDGDPGKPILFSNLGCSHQSRFERLGELSELNKAIMYKTQAVLLTPDGHVDKPGSLGNLGNSYEVRFGRLGELTDLNKAIEYKTQAVLLTPDEDADKPRRLNNLGNSYESRFGRLREVTDLNRAIDLQTQAVMLTPDGHADKPALLNNLGISYRSRFKQLDEFADFKAAIECLAQAVQLTPNEHPLKPGWLGNLGTSYQFRFERLGELVDSNKAIECQTQAVQLTPDGHLNKPSLLSNLGTTYESRFGYLGNSSDLELAREYFHHGARLMIVHPLAQSKCARGWARCSLLLGSSPQPAYERAMELIPHLVWLGTTISQRYTLLAEIRDLATEAAAWAIEVKAYNTAVEWFEQGRSIVWNQILQLRSPFDDLSSVNAELAQQLKDIATELDAASPQQGTASLHNHYPLGLEEEVQKHYHLASEWERLLTQARSISGFEDFLQPCKIKKLKLAAADGPVIILNAHSTRCDALIIFPDCIDVVHLSLPSCSLDKLGQIHVQLQELVGHRGHRAGGFNRLNPSTSFRNMFQPILATLWLEVVQPILNLLVSSDDAPSKELPHVTWCTTGALSFLPLHAAGCYDGLSLNALDLVVSSYTPSLSALLAPRALEPSQRLGVLAIGLEHTRGFCALPNTVHELAAIREQAQAVQFQQLSGSNATVNAVLNAMEQHSWVHLACHATQNREDPTRSAFHLHDGSLTLEAIAECSFINKGLAFLSACQTATGDEQLANESVHLAAGMLMAGYPSVIATMWSIQDEDGPIIARGVYEHLLNDGKMNHKEAARALHRAVVGLRKKVGSAEFLRWVPFIHIGV